VTRAAYGGAQTWMQVKETIIKNTIYVLTEYKFKGKINFRGH
jgi:hypothetical protein